MLLKLLVHICCSGAACGCKVMLFGCGRVDVPADFSKSCDAKCSAEDKEDATSGCEM